MILDSGLCSIFQATDGAQAGGMPVKTYTLLTQGWYGVLSFETNPARPTEGRTELRTDLRIRILQNIGIKQNDAVVLRLLDKWKNLQSGETVYRITRAYHGEDGPTPITDLSLEVFTP